MLKLIVIIFMLSFISYVVVRSGEIHFGPISEIRSRIKELKKKVDKARAEEEWKILTSPLGEVGEVVVYTSKNRLIGPYNVHGNVAFQGGETEIEAGVILYFQGDFNIRFEGGSLKVKGTSLAPVIFRDKKQDAYKRSAGNWGFVDIRECTTNINYAIFEYGKGLWISGDGNIENSIFRENYAGIKIGKDATVPHHTVTIKYSEIENNEEDPDGDRGEGIGIFGSKSRVNIYYCVISSNVSSGILVADFDALSISSNNLSKNIEYEFKNTSPKDINVPNNWWGTTSTDTIKSKIYDYDEFPALYGVVNFEPISNSTFTDAGVR